MIAVSRAQNMHRLGHQQSSSTTPATVRSAPRLDSETSLGPASRETKLSEEGRLGAALHEIAIQENGQEARQPLNITAWCVALLAENDNLKFNFLERPGMLQRSAALEMLLKIRSIFRHAGICREQRNYCSEFAGAAPTHLSNMAINRVPGGAAAAHKHRPGIRPTVRGGIVAVL